MTKILSYSDIERIAFSDLVRASEPVITNSGLSPELIQELSQDISDDTIIQLLKIYVNGVWQNYCNVQDELAGVTADGQPIYQTVWNNETWLYAPFEMGIDTIKSSGEIVSTGIQMQNYNPEFLREIEKPAEAIPIKRYIISKKYKTLLVEDELKYLTSITNTGIMIQGDVMPADILNEPLSCQTYNGSTFRR